MNAKIDFFSRFPKNHNQQIILPELNAKKVQLWIKREDAIHPFVSGNKFRKLKYNILKAFTERKSTLLTFGGAFSNHIAATAVAANLSGLKSIGIIRGDELANNFNEVVKTNFTLKTAFENGMQLEFVARDSYREKNEEYFIKKLKAKFGDFYLIPEGGTNSLAVKGCEEILDSTDDAFDFICAAIGTGGTISGLINASKIKQKVFGFPALKGDFLENEIHKFTSKSNWELIPNYHLGGYAKYSIEFINFLNNFTKETNILLDPIYTGKMVYGIVDLVKKDYFDEGAKILAIHTGGLQGIYGFNKKLAKKGLKLNTK